MPILSRRVVKPRLGLSACIPARSRDPFDFGFAQRHRVAVIRDKAPIAGRYEVPMDDAEPMGQNGAASVATAIALPGIHACSERLMEDMTTESLPEDPRAYFDAHIFVCCNRRPDGHPRGSCAAKGSEALRDYMKARVKEARIPHARVNMAGCLDRCEEGPCVVIYPAGVWYRIESRADVDAIIEQLLTGGGQADALRLPPDRSP
jgi:(2Fe-2S) ferredoxin